MPELNPSNQCCLPEFFIGDFNVYYQKKSISHRLFLLIQLNKIFHSVYELVNSEKSSPIFIINLGM
jgi:hypothetical protein